MATNSHIILRQLEQGEMIPPEISTGVRMPIPNELYKSTAPQDAMVVGFQKYTEPDKDTCDLLVAASPVLCRVIIDSAFRQTGKIDTSSVTDTLQKSAILREREGREEYRRVNLQRWNSAMRKPLHDLRLRINTDIEPHQQAYMLFGERIDDHADFADTIIGNMVKMSRSRTSLCERIGFVSGGDAEVVFVDTINSKRVTI